MLRSSGMERKSVLFLVGFFCFLNAEKLLFRDKHQWLEEEEGRRQGEGAPPSFPFQDPTLPWDQRLDDLVTRLTLDEIVPQTLAVYGSHTPAIPRLNINPYVWISECLHGEVSTHGTAFPQSIGLAASFSDDLVHDVAEATSYEVRAHWNENRKKGTYASGIGLSCFSPVINIMRHPLWGRNQETYGEDPYVAGKLVQGYVRGLQGNNSRYVRANAGCKHFDVHGGPENIPVSRFSYDAKESYGEDPYVAGKLVQGYVRGLQGNHSRYVRANAGCKHFDVHGGPENIPVSRSSFDAKVSMRDWRMTFLPQFKMCVDAGSYSLMCSYNSINGVPACANQQLLTNITRTEWGFTGYVVSDAGAVSNIISEHRYLKTPEETVAACINAGCNLELGSSIFTSTAQAIAKGLLTERQVRDNVRALMHARLRLGEFDPEEMNPYNIINMSVVQSDLHRELALQAAMKTFVLLKNDGLLPLTKTYSRVAVVGPFAQEANEIYGDYSPDVSRQFTTTVAEGLVKLSSKVVAASGCNGVKCTSYSREGVADAVEGADLVVVALGTGSSIESEGNDRADIGLPGHQFEVLLDAVRMADGKPVILLLFNAGPLDVTWAKFNPKVSAILECFFPGERTGDAIYHTLTASSGTNSIPAGRLPATWPSYLAQVPSITNYDMAGHTYRYYNGEPLYPFGYGLSYTSFLYSSLTLSSQSIMGGQNITATVGVLNTGKMDADEVIQVYISWPNTKLVVPKIQLVAFTRILIKAGEHKLVDLVITPERISVWGDDGWTYVKGKMTVYAGGQQPNQSTCSSSNTLQASFLVN